MVYTNEQKEVMEKHRLNPKNYFVIQETESELIVFDWNNYKRRTLQKEIEVDFVYMKVTKDKYEYPLIVADSIAELSKILGIGREVIHRGIKNQNSSYKKVDLRGV